MIKVPAETPCPCGCFQQTVESCGNNTPGGGCNCRYAREWRLFGGMVSPNGKANVPRAGF